MNIQKMIIMNGLKAYFIGVTKLRIDITDGTMIIETKDGAREEPAKYSEYFAQVIEAYGLKTLKIIFIDFQKDVIVLSGTCEVWIEKDILDAHGTSMKVKELIEKSKDVVI